MMADLEYHDIELLVYVESKAIAEMNADVNKELHFVQVSAEEMTQSAMLAQKELFEWLEALDGQQSPIEVTMSGTEGREESDFCRRVRPTASPRTTGQSPGAKQSPMALGESERR